MKPKLILVCGKKRSGKNVFSDYVQEYFNSNGYSVKQDMMAGELKERSKVDFAEFTRALNESLEMIRIDANMLFNGNLNYHNGGSVLETINRKIEDLKITDDKWYEKKNVLTRALLQCYGTDIMRNRVSDTYWTDIMKDKVIADWGTCDVTLITDVRFPNEIECFYDGVIDELYDIFAINIVRNMKIGFGGSHESEISLDDFNSYHYIVNNDSGLKELKKSAEIIAKEIHEHDKYKLEIGEEYQTGS